MRNHGTHACYVFGPEGQGKGCRCRPCKDAAAAYERERKRRAAPAYVNATRARHHIEHLATQGIGLKTVSAASGISTGTLSKLMYGTRNRAPSQRIRPETEKAILGVTTRDAAPRAKIPAAQTWAHINTLLGRGWTKTAIARALGNTTGVLQLAKTTVTAANARKIEQLLDQPVPDRVDRHGNITAADWDPDTERRDKLRRAAQAEERAGYRAAARAQVDDLPTIDLAALAAETWRQQAACRLLPDDQTWIFWPGVGDHQAVAAARQVCATCPAAQACLDHALTHHEAGIWGGRSEKERREMRNGLRPPVAIPAANVDKRRPCHHCGQLFLPASHRSKHCSRGCAMRARHLAAVS